MIYKDGYGNVPMENVVPMIPKVKPTQEKYST